MEFLDDPEQQLTAALSEFACSEMCLETVTESVSWLNDFKKGNSQWLYQTMVF